MNNTAATAPQGQTQDVFNQTNQNVLAQNQQQALLQQLQQATASQYVPQGAGNQTQQPGQLPTPLYDFQNMYAPMQAISQAQLGNIQQNVVKQQSLRALSNEGYQAVAASMDLYKKAHQKGKNSRAETLNYIPGLYPERKEELLSMVGTARSRVNERYRGSLENLSGRFSLSVEKAALNMGREALIDYATGMIINSQTNTNPFMDASVMEATARTQARELVDAYTSLLPKKKISSDKDLEKILSYINGYAPDNDSDLYIVQDSLNKIGAESAYVDSYATDLQDHAFEAEEQILTSMNDPDMDQTPVSINDLPLPEEEKVSVGYLTSSLNRIHENTLSFVKGATKQGARDLKNIAQAVVSVPASLLDIVATPLSGTTSPFMSKVRSIGNAFDEMVKIDRENGTEQFGSFLTQAAFTFALGASFLPIANPLAAIGVGVAVGIGAYGGQEAIFGITNAALDLMFGDDREHPAREVIENIVESVVNVVTMYLLHKAASSTSAKSTSLWTVMEPTAEKTLKNLEPSMRKIVIEEAKKINVKEAAEQLGNIDAIDSYVSQKEPYGILSGIRGILRQQPVLAESNAIMRYGEEAAIRETTNILSQSLKKRDPTFTGSTSESVGTHIFKKLAALTKTNEGVFNEAFKNPVYKTSSEMVPPQLVDKLIGVSESSSKVKDGLINGFAKYREKLLLQEAASENPTIQHQVKGIKQLEKDIKRGDPYAINLSISKLEALPNTLLQDLIMSVGEEYVEGEPSYKSSNRQIIRVKQALKEHLYSFFTSDEQRNAYDAANKNSALLKKTMVLYGNFDPTGDMPPIVESTTLLNKEAEYTHAMNKIRAIGLKDKVDPKILKELDNIKNFTVYYPVIQALGRKPAFTPRMIETIQAKVQGAAVTDAVKKDILQPLDFLSHYLKATTTDLNKTPPVATEQDAVLGIVGKAITVIGNMASRIAGTAASTLMGIVESVSGITHADKRNVCIFLDVLDANPQLAKALKLVLESRNKQFGWKYVAGKAAQSTISSRDKERERREYEED